MTTTPTLLAGRYRLAQSLGVGGMGRVWLARDETLDRNVAIKEIVLPAELTGDRDALHRRTLREARAAARLNHPNVVQVYDVLDAADRTWIVMEYVASRSLRQVMLAEGPLPPRLVALVGLELLAALRAAHRAGVWHRDVKPANVLLADDGRVVLTDFGIATIEDDGVVTRSGLVLGSPEYMSPERARYGTDGAASDLWSLGTTLYAAVEGRSPFKRPSAIETLTALATGEPDPPNRAGTLRPALDGLLRKNPAARTDLDETERRLRLAATTDRLPPPRRLRVTAAAATVLVLALATAIWLAVRPHAGSSARSEPGQAPTTAAPTVTAPAGTPSLGSTPTPTPASTPTPGQGGGPGAGQAGRPRPALPAGWRDHRDPTGFAVYVPKGWATSRDGSMVYFRDAKKGRVLGIDQTDEPRSNPVADWRGKASYRVARGDFPGYDEIRIVSVKYWQKAADWEYTFNGRTRQHVNNRGVVVSASQAYGIYWQTSHADWKAAKPDLKLVFDSFRPAKR